MAKRPFARLACAWYCVVALGSGGLLLIASGCADLRHTSGDAQNPLGRQQLSVTTFSLVTEEISKPSWQQLPPEKVTWIEKEINAHCTLSNDKGKWTIDTPGDVLIELSRDKLVVECVKEGYTQGLLRLSCHDHKSDILIQSLASGQFSLIAFPLALGYVALTPPDHPCVFKPTLQIVLRPAGRLNPEPLR